jgi:hypothetical protein
LGVISAHMQDAVIRLDDIRYLKQRRTFALVANRYVWDDEKQKQRRRTGLHFESVVSVKSHNIRQGDDEAVIVLLSMSFMPGEAPGGVIELTFSGGGSIRLDVECIDARMRDLGPAWQTGSTPAHGD